MRQSPNFNGTFLNKVGSLCHKKKDDVPIKRIHYVSLEWELSINVGVSSFIICLSILLGILTSRVWEYRIEYRPDTYLDTFFVSFHCISEQCICIRKSINRSASPILYFFYFTLNAFSTTVKGKGLNLWSVYKSW